MATQNPQRTELGLKLRGGREAAGLKPAQVEQDLRWYAGKLSRVENGRRIPAPAEVDRMVELYRFESADREKIYLLFEEARKKESPSRVADWAQTYVTYERAASEIAYWDGYLVSGLLQTDAYARALLGTSGSTEVETWVAERIGRQKILTRENPPAVRVLLGQAVLYQDVGGEDVLVEQLAHLLSVGELPNVSIRIIPFSAGAHRGLGLTFTHLRLDEPETTRVYIEGATDATYINDTDENAVYMEIFDASWSKALDEEASATILRRRIGIE